MTISFLAYELAVNQEIQGKLFEEIGGMEDELGGKTINYEQIRGLKYLDQVVSGVLRMASYSCK